MLNQEGNSTRLVLLTELQQQLNDPNAKMWTVLALNGYLQRAVTRWYNKMIRLSHEYGNRTADVTYTALAESVDLSASLTHGMRRIIKLEDRTSQQPGPIWTSTQTLLDLHEYHLVVNDSGRFYGQPRYVIAKSQSGTLAAAQTVGIYIYSAPPPTTARSLRLYYQGAAPQMSADGATTGMPPEVEECVLLQASVYAKYQEDENVPQSWKDLLAEGERHMREAARPHQRVPKRIRYISDD